MKGAAVFVVTMVTLWFWLTWVRDKPCSEPFWAGAKFAMDIVCPQLVKRQP